MDVNIIDLKFSYLSGRDSQISFMIVIEIVCPVFLWRIGEVLGRIVLRSSSIRERSDQDQTRCFSV